MLIQNLKGPLSKEHFFDSTQKYLQKVGCQKCHRCQRYIEKAAARYLTHLICIIYLIQIIYYIWYLIFIIYNISKIYHMAKFIFEGCLISNAFSLWYWKSLKSFCKRADCQEGGRRGGVKVKLKRCEARPGQKRAHSGTLTRYFISSVREEALIFFFIGGGESSTANVIHTLPEKSRL